MEQHTLTWFTATTLHHPDLRHGFTTRRGGVSKGAFASLNLRPMHDDPAAILENYRRICGALDMDRDCCVLSHQVHQDTVRLVTELDAGKGLHAPRDYEADGLITNVENLPLVVFSADCGTILLHDPVNRAIGAVHAGWRGCALGIVAKTVREMTAHFGTDPQELQVAIGPCIGQCCFETHGDVPQAMEDALGQVAKQYIRTKGEKFLVDLAGLNRQWLLNAGVPLGQIETIALCTACHGDLFWSHRKLGNNRGVQCALIALATREGGGR